MRPIDVQAIHGRDESGEPRETDTAEDAALEPGDDGLVHARGPLQLALGPAEHDPAALDGGSQDLEPELDLGETPFLRLDSPGHRSTLATWDHQAPIGRFTTAHPARDAAEVHH
jgi:hypothetical protein